MTDLTITAASVTWVSGVRPFIGKAGATITPGQPVYFDTTTNKYKLTDGDTDAESLCAGISLDGGVDGRDMLIAPPGAVINIGSTVVLGTVYVCSLTPGGIAPWADLATGDYVTLLFMGATNNIVEILCKRQYAGVHA